MKFKKLDKATLWKDEKSGSYFFRLEYIYEDDIKISRIIYPKVETGIPIDAPFLGANYLDDVRLGATPLTVMHFITTFGCCDHALLKDNKDRYMYEEVLEEKVHEMTLDEIENKLGHKVKIVNDWSNKEGSE